MGFRLLHNPLNRLDNQFRFRLHDKMTALFSHDVAAVGRTGCVGQLEFQVWHERVGYLATPDWTKGRFEMEIKPGVNDLGTIKVAASLLEE